MISNDSLFGMTNSSGGEYRGSSIPYNGLKFTPVHMSTAAPKSMIFTEPSTVMMMFSG